MTPSLPMITAANESRALVIVAIAAQRHEMITACAWCQTPGMERLFRGLRVSHGICPACFAAEMAASNVSDSKPQLQPA